MKLTERQTDIINIVKQKEPISSRNIADKLGVSKAAIRTDLSVLTVLKILEAKPNVGYYVSNEDLTYRNFDDLKNITVSQIMVDAVTIKEDTSIYNTVVEMFVVDVGTVFIVDQEDKLYGVVSRKDLLKMSIGKSDLKKTPVSLAMTRMPNIITLTPEDKFYRAAEKIYDNKVDSLPVINKNNKVIAKVSKTTIISTFVNFERGGIK